MIYCSITGYGQTGTYKDKAGHDINYLAETGVLALMNPIGLPGVTFADGMAGVSAALNIVAAIHARTHSGKGQPIDCAIVDGPLSLMTSEFEYYWNTGESRTIGANHLTGSHPWYGVHATRDGEHVAVGAVEPPFYHTLCQGLDLPEFMDQQFSQGSALEQANEKIVDGIAACARDEVTSLFENQNACVSPVLNTQEVMESPLSARAVVTDSRGTQRVRTPVRLPSVESSSTKTERELLSSLHFSNDEIEQLQQLGVIN